MKSLSLRSGFLFLGHFGHRSLKDQVHSLQLTAIPSDPLHSLTWLLVPLSFSYPRPRNVLFQGLWGIESLYFSQFGDTHMQGHCRNFSCTTFLLSPQMGFPPIQTQCNPTEWNASMVYLQQLQREWKGHIVDNID